MCLPNFNAFGNFGRNFVTEKFKGSLIAPVLMTSKRVTGSLSLWQRFQRSTCLIFCDTDRQCRFCVSIANTKLTIGSLFLQPLGWRCVECAVQHERDVREE